jgi:predicted acyl esterase
MPLARLHPLPHARAAAALLAATVALLLPTGAHAAAPAWWSYARPAEYGSVRTAVRVPMRDGVRLACQLTRPATNGRPAAGRFPGIVYEVTPYALLDPFFVEHGAYFAAHGYVAITCTVRGTGASEGAYPQLNQPAEQTDAFDLVEWLAAQPFSDGRVGQTGESYGGMSAYRAAAAQPPHLRAIAPQQAPNDLYLEDVYPGGVPAQPVLHQWWPLIGELTSLGGVSAARMYAVQARHPRRDAFWEQVAIDTVLDRIEVPVLAFAGWNDPLFRSGAVRNVQRLAALDHGDRTWLIAGPWEHNYVVDWRGCRVVPACVGFQRVPTGAILAWFDRWVAELPGAPLPASHVTSYQQGTGGAGWRELGEIEALGATAPTSLALTTGGALAAEAGAAGTRAWRATPLQGLTERVRSIAFTTPPLEAPRALLGRPTLLLAARTTGRDANLHASLRLITSTRTRTIAEGWLRASHRRSHRLPSPLTPGEPFTARIELAPLDLALPAGSRLELRLDSGSAAAVQPLPQPLSVQVATGAGGSTLELPLR